MLSLFVNKMLVYIFLYRNTKKEYIRGVYGIRSRLIFCAKVYKKKEYNSREIINTKELFKSLDILANKGLFQIFEKYKELYNHIHPFICNEYLQKQNVVYGENYLEKIENYILKYNKFPCDKFSRTLYIANHERKMLRILDAICIAGSVYNNNNRYMYSTNFEIFQ
jgi:hypothetical protein